MSKIKSINSSAIIASKEVLGTTIFKLAILKGRMAMRNMKDFLLSKEWHPLRNFSGEEFNSLKNGKTLSDKFKLAKTSQNFDFNDYTKLVSAENFLDNGLNKGIDFSGDASGMSAAQNVYKVIFMQQIEWMDETVQKT